MVGFMSKNVLIASPNMCSWIWLQYVYCLVPFDLRKVFLNVTDLYGCFTNLKNYEGDFTPPSAAALQRMLLR